MRGVVSHWQCPDCKTRCFCAFPEGEHRPCTDDGLRRQGPHLMVVTKLPVVRLPEDAQRCLGFPLGSCPVTIWDGRALCSFCVKSKRLAS